MPQNNRIVRGRIAGGTRGAFLIAVNEEWGRVFNLDGRELSRLAPLQSVVAQNPEAFSQPFDGDEDQEQAILDAAHEPDVVEDEFDEYDLPNVDLIDRDEWH